MGKEVSKRQRHVIHLMLIGGFLGSMNQTILGPVLPSIMADLHINAVSGQWLTTIFLLINGIMIPCTAYLSARFTTRQLFLSSMLLFAVGTALAGVSHEFFSLLLARSLQALGFGILMPLLASTILIVYPREHHGRAMGTLGLVMSVAPAIGPSLAGWIVDKYSWNTVFMALLPLIVLDILLSFFLMENIDEHKEVSLDIPSVILSTIGFGGLLYGFSVAGSEGWLSLHTVGSIFIGALVLYFFINRQKHIDTPLLNVSVFSDRQFTVGTIIGMLVNAALLFGGILTPIYLQEIHGFNAFVAALIMLPAALLSALANPIVGAIYDKYNARYVILIGLAFLTVGSFSYTTFQIDSSIPYLVFCYTLRIIGISITMMPVNTWSMRRLERAIIPHGTAASNTLRQVAGSVGTAFIISIYMMIQPFSSATDPTLISLFGIHVAFGVSGCMMVAAMLLALKEIKK